MKRLLTFAIAALVAGSIAGCGKIKLQKKTAEETKTESQKTPAATTDSKAADTKKSDDKTTPYMTPTKELTITQEVNDSVDNAANSSASTARKIQNNIKSKVSKLSGGAVDDPNAKKKKTKKPKDEL